jgi:hypothetical protein
MSPTNLMPSSARSVEFVGLEPEGVQFGGGAGGAPARPEANGSGVEEF